MKAYLSPIVIFLAIALVIVVVVVQTNSPARVAPEAVVAEQTSEEVEPTETAGAIQVNPDSILGVLQASGQHTVLLQVLAAAGASDVFNGDSGNITLFAPIDAAFNMLPSGVLENLLKPENKQQIEYILLRHVFNQRLQISDMVRHGAAGRMTVKSAAGSDIVLVRLPEGPWVVETEYKERATFVSPDNAKLNGIIHSIDRVLVTPGTMQTKPMETKQSSELPSGKAILFEGNPADFLAGEVPLIAAPGVESAPVTPPVPAAIPTPASEPAAAVAPATSGETAPVTAP